MQHHALLSLRGGTTIRHSTNCTGSKTYPALSIRCGTVDHEILFFARCVDDSHLTAAEI